MYGLGIRIGFYLQWYGAIVASWLARTEVQGLRISLAFFIAATFLALVIQTVQDKLEIVEIYIILLLTFGSYLSLVPLFAWRFVTECQPLWDPSRFPMVDPGPTHSDLHVPLLLSVVAFQLWYWFVRIPELAVQKTCQQYGFLFAKIRLDGVVFQVINIVLNFILGVIVVCLAIIRLVKVAFGIKEEDKIQRDRMTPREQAQLDARIALLHNLDSMFKLATASAVIVAAELTIKWNTISGVNDLSSAGQLIPFVIGLGSLLRVFYVRWKRGDEPDMDISNLVQPGERMPILSLRPPRYNIQPFDRLPQSFPLPRRQSFDRIPGLAGSTGRSQSSSVSRSERH
jgi:hypothetical protein